MSCHSQLKTSSRELRTTPSLRRRGRGGAGAGADGPEEGMGTLGRAIRGQVRVREREGGGCGGMGAR